MREAFTTLDPLAIIVVAVIGFVLGWGARGGQVAPYSLDEQTGPHRFGRCHANYCRELQPEELAILREQGAT